MLDARKIARPRNPGIETSARREGIRWFGESTLSTLFALSFAIACTSVGNPSRISPESFVEKRREVLWESLRFRRPAFPPATPDGGPGGADYETAPRTLKRPWNCVLPRRMLQNAGLNPARILDCQRRIAAVQSAAAAAPATDGDGAGSVVPIRARWNLERTHPAAWVLKERSAAEGTECLEETLGRIPVPREAFFLSPDSTGSLECFGTGLDPGSKEHWDATLPWDRLKLEMSFPLLSAEALNAPGISREDHEDELIRILLGVAFQPLWRPEGGVPRGIDRMAASECRACLGSEAWERIQSSRELTLWPSGKPFVRGKVRPGAGSVAR